MRPLGVFLVIHRYATMDTGQWVYDVSMKKKSCRGLACMPVWKRKKIAALGGTAAHAKGTAHIFTTKTARQAIRIRYAK